MMRLGRRTTRTGCTEQISREIRISRFLSLRATLSVLSSLSEGRLVELWPRSTHSERLVSGSQNVRTTHNTPHTDTTRRERHTTHANGSLGKRSMFTFSTRWFIDWVLKVKEQNPTIAEIVEHATVINGCHKTGPLPFPRRVSQRIGLTAGEHWPCSTQADFYSGQSYSGQVRLGPNF